MEFFEEKIEESIDQSFFKLWRLEEILLSRGIISVIKFLEKFLSISKEQSKISVLLLTKLTTIKIPHFTNWNIYIYFVRKLGERRGAPQTRRLCNSRNFPEQLE